MTHHFYSDIYVWAVFGTVTLQNGTRVCDLSETADTIVWLNFSKQIGFVWDRKITVYSSMMTKVCVIPEYRKITHSNDSFNPNLTKMISHVGIWKARQKYIIFQNKEL